MKFSYVRSYSSGVLGNNNCGGLGIDCLIASNSAPYRRCTVYQDIKVEHANIDGTVFSKRAFI